MLRTAIAMVVLASLCSLADQAAWGQYPTADYPSTAYPSTSFPNLPAPNLPVPNLPVPNLPVLSAPSQNVPPTADVPNTEPQIPETLPPATGSSSSLPTDPTDGISALTDGESWVLPSYWFNPIDWEGSFEVGINGTEGNAQALSMRFGGDLKRKTELYELASKITYVKATSNGQETQHNALFNSRFDRLLGDSPWTFFLKDSLEYDEFKAFDLRFAANAGLGYQFIDSENTKLKGRYGAGTSREIGGPNDRWVPELVYGADFKRQLTKRQKLELTVDYFPEWGNFNNYRLVTIFGWEVLLDEAHNLNLKLSINDRYDSTPNGRRPNDINYALLLLWKL